MAKPCVHDKVFEEVVAPILKSVAKDASENPEWIKNTGKAWDISGQKDRADFLVSWGRIAVPAARKYARRKFKSFTPKEQSAIAVAYSNKIMCENA